MRIKHWLVYTGPAFVPSSTDEISASETTSGTEADVGITASTNALTVPNANDVDTVGA